MPSRKTFLTIAGPTAFYALAEEATVMMPKTLFQIFGLQRFVQNPDSFGRIQDQERLMAYVQLLLVGLVGLVTAALVLIPATVALKRVQASMLPEEDESIVPFDRTFGGAVVPKILGGSGRVAMLEAWKSFDWNARVRLVKLYAKIALIQTTVTVLFGMVIAAELYYIMGDQLRMLLQLARAQADANAASQWEVVTLPDSALEPST